MYIEEQSKHVIEVVCSLINRIERQAMNPIRVPSSIFPELCGWRHALANWRQRCGIPDASCLRLRFYLTPADASKKEKERRHARTQSGSNFSPQVGRPRNRLLEESEL